MTSNKISATFVDTPDSDLKCVNAARVSFLKKGTEFQPGDSKLLRYLATHRHWTPFAHCRDTFVFKGSQQDIFKLLSSLTQEQTAPMVWKRVDAGIAIRTSLFGWAELMNQWAEGDVPYVDNIFQVFTVLSHKYPESTKHLFSERVQLMSNVADGFEVHAIPPEVADDDYFTDITMHEVVPIFVARQRFKHKIGFEYNEVSRRYVSDEPTLYDLEYRLRPEGSIKQGSGDVIDYVPTIKYQCRITRIEELTSAIVDWYNIAVSDDCKVAPEVARANLPQSMMTEYYVTGHMVAWKRLLKQRLSSDAQKEIRILGQEVEKGLVRYLNDVDFDLD